MPHAPRIKYICITHDGKKWTRSSSRPFDDLGRVAEMKEVFTSEDLSRENREVISRWGILLKTVARVGERGIISSIKLKPTLGRTILVKS
jgi:hypothetical protein